MCGRQWDSLVSGSNSAGRVRPCQGRCRGFESRLPLHYLRYQPTTKLNYLPTPPSPKRQRGDITSTSKVACRYMRAFTAPITANTIPNVHTIAAPVGKSSLTDK